MLPLQRLHGGPGATQTRLCALFPACQAEGWRRGTYACECSSYQQTMRRLSGAKPKPPAGLCPPDFCHRVLRSFPLSFVRPFVSSRLCLPLSLSFSLSLSLGISIPLSLFPLPPPTLLASPRTTPPHPQPPVIAIEIAVNSYN